MRSIGQTELNWDRLRIRSATISLVGACCVSLLLVFGSKTAAAQNPRELRSPSEFSGIQDPQMRSRALFAEAAKVIMNPRCMSCHPATDSPLQGNDQHIHMPPVTRGANGGGVAGNTTCGVYYNKKRRLRTSICRITKMRSAETVEDTRRNPNL